MEGKQEMLWAGQYQGKQPPSLSRLPGVCQDSKEAISFHPGMEVCLSSQIYSLCPYS